MPIDNWWDRLYPGAMVRPDPLWNQTTGTRRMRLPDVCKVLEVRWGQVCETGVLITVQNMGGDRVDLSAGWFTSIVE